MLVLVWNFQGLESGKVNTWSYRELFSSQCLLLCPWYYCRSHFLSEMHCKATLSEILPNVAAHFFLGSKLVIS